MVAGSNFFWFFSLVSLVFPEEGTCQTKPHQIFPVFKPVTMLVCCCRCEQWFIIIKTNCSCKTLVRILFWDLQNWVWPIYWGKEKNVEAWNAYFNSFLVIRSLVYAFYLRWGSIFWVGGRSGCHHFLCKANLRSSDHLKIKNNTNEAASLESGEWTPTKLSYKTFGQMETDKPP